MKVLFLHNAVPEYRIEFWKILSANCDLDLLITSKGLEQKIYKLEKDSSELNIFYLSIGNIRSWIHDVRNYDIVVLPPVDNIYLYLIAKVFLWTCIKADRKVILWTEGWSWHKIPIIKKLYKKMIFMLRHNIAKQCDACIASGSKAYQFLEKSGIEKAKLNIAIDSSTSPKCSYDLENIIFDKIENKKKILFLGRIIKRKGCDILIKAFDNVYKGNKNICLIIGGEGPDLERCKKIARSLKSYNNIYFIGKIQPSKRAFYYRMADVFVLPSYAYHGTVEAWGLTVNESMEQGTPVIATNAVGAAYDLLDNKYCGEIVNENSVGDLQTAIIHILEIPREETRSACIKEYTKYSVSNMAHSFYEVFSACK